MEKVFCSMSGIEKLDKLLRNMSPQLHDEEFVFCSFEFACYGDFADLNPIASFAEDEGLTLILLKDYADSQCISYDVIFRLITLTVHSSLEAVGLIAVVANKLAEHEISANVVAAYYHDHIFVPCEKAEKAMEVLCEF